MKTENSFLQQLLNDSSFVNWARNANNNDIEYWNTWINNNPSRIQTIDTAKAIILGIKFEKNFPANYKVEKELSKILPRLQAYDSITQNSIKKNPFKKYFSLSAAALILVLIAWSGFQFYTNSTTTVHKTNYGEIIDLRLPDGSSVVLNGNSEIQYKNNSPRNIFLKGEAYFKVKSIPSTKAKFWVHTEDLKVEVLGTQFHVNTRKKRTNVVLDEGSIHLEFENGDVKKMIPGELVTFSKGSDKLVHTKVTVTTPYALWRDGTYTFNEIALKEVMANIEYTYGVKVKYQHPQLQQLLITGGVPNQNLKLCIAAIELATNTRIIHKNNTLLIQNNLNN
jgi:transmembrane sensor